MWINIFSHIVVENIKLGKNTPSRKTGFRLKKLEVQTGYTKGI
jgi:hypothetical protein